MAPFLSTEWIAELDAEARRAPELADVLSGDDELVIQHIVTDDDGVERVTFHFRLGAGSARVRPGRAADPTVTFTQSTATVRAIARGEIGGQAAFMGGDLRLGGRVDVLLTHHATLSGISDVFAVVRERTEW